MKVGKKSMKQIREEILLKRKKEGKIKILVHMGTCCIAAGSDKVLSTMKKEVKNLSLESKVEVVPGGCIGLCYAEPTVSVLHPDGRYEIYGTVDAPQSRIIVNRCRTQSPIMGLNQIDVDWKAVTIEPEA